MGITGELDGAVAMSVKLKTWVSPKIDMENFRTFTGLRDSILMISPFKQEQVVSFTASKISDPLRSPVWVIKVHYRC